MLSYMSSPLRWLQVPPGWGFGRTLWHCRECQGSSHQSSNCSPSLWQWSPELHSWRLEERKESSVCSNRNQIHSHSKSRRPVLQCVIEWSTYGQKDWLWVCRRWLPCEGPIGCRSCHSQRCRWSGLSHSGTLKGSIFLVHILLSQHLFARELLSRQNLATNK